MTGIVYWASIPTGKSISVEVQIEARGPVTIQTIDAQQYTATSNLTSGAEYFDLAALESVEFLPLPHGAYQLLEASNGGGDQVVIIMDGDIPNQSGKPRKKHASASVVETAAS